MSREFKAKSFRAKSFRSGNSVALRLPVAMGVEAGRDWHVRVEEDGSFTVSAVQPESRKIDLTGIWGSIPGLKLLTPEERSFEELDWEGKLLPRG